MAANRKKNTSRFLSVTVTDGGATSGAPARWGSRIGVALNDIASGVTVLDFGPAVYSLSVKGVDGSGNSAVAAGDAIFYVDADTPKLSKKNTGYFAGFALGAVSSGATATIDVALCDSPGSGTLGTGTVGTTNLAAGAVTAAKLSTNLKKGYIPLPLASFREIATNDYINTAGDAGVLSSNTTPLLQRVNAATDKASRIVWAATNVDEIVAQFDYPPDLDDSAAVEVHLQMRMAGATDTPVVAVSYFENVGDTNAGGNTTALSATIADKVVTIAAGDIAAYPNFASIGIVPGAHGTDAAWLYGAHIEYTRKD